MQYISEKLPLATPYMAFCHSYGSIAQKKIIL